MTALICENIADQRHTALGLSEMVPCAIGVKVLAFIGSHFDPFISNDKDEKR